MQDCSISSALAMEIQQSCTKPRYILSFVRGIQQWLVDYHIKGHYCRKCLHLRKASCFVLVRVIRLKKASGHSMNIWRLGNTVWQQICSLWNKARAWIYTENKLYMTDLGIEKRLSLHAEGAQFGYIWNASNILYLIQWTGPCLNIKMGFRYKDKMVARHLFLWV